MGMLVSSPEDRTSFATSESSVTPMERMMSMTTMPKARPAMASMVL